ncbi:hypothetical protein N2152v2_008499 [Parachlorella kessleri]
MATTCYTGHLPETGPLSASSADIELLLGDTVFLAHRDFLEGQSWILQGLFESHAEQRHNGGGAQGVPRVQLGATRATAGGAAIAAEAQQALQPAQLSRFLYQAYHPEAPIPSADGEAQVLDLLSAADFFSDDTLKAKCDAALAASAATVLKGLHDPLPLATIDSPTQHKLSSLDLEDSATQVLQEHGSPVTPAEDEWGSDFHALLANNVKAKDREELVRYLRLASRFGLPRVTAQCLPHLCKLIVAASAHHNLRHTIQECLPLLDDPAKTVMLFEVAQLAAEATGEEGLRAWRLDPSRCLRKLQEYESQEATLSRLSSQLSPRTP